MKRICLVFLLMFAAMTLVAQVSKTSHPLLSGVYKMNVDGDTLESETIKYDKFNRCVQIVSQSKYIKQIQSFSYPDNRTVVVTTADENSETVMFYALNEAGQAITDSYIYQAYGKIDTLVSRIIHLSNGFAVNLQNYDYEICNKADEELKLLGINPEEFITVSEGNIIKDMAESVYEYYANQPNTIGKLNRGIYYLGVDNKNPVKSEKEKEDAEFGFGIYQGYSYLYDDQGRIIKQLYNSTEYIFKSFDYVDQ